MRPRPLVALVALVVASAMTVAACSRDGRELRPPSPDQTISILTTPTTGPVPTPETLEPIAGPTVSLPWLDGGAIPVDYTCEGLDISPAVAWSGIPSGTAEIAIVMTEATGFVHWVVSGLSPATGQVGQGGVPEEAAQSRNDYGGVGYKGPCPVAGTGEHQYFVTVYALREASNLADGGDPIEAIQRLDEALLTSTTLLGLFGQP